MSANREYLVKAFKPFEILRQTYPDLEMAKERFDQLVQGGEYDAVYVFEDGHGVMWWAENYDEPGGGHDEDLAYLTMSERYQPRVVVGKNLVEPDGVSMLDEFEWAILDMETNEPAYLSSGQYLVYFSGTSELASEIAIMHDDYADLRRVIEAAGQALADGDVDFARLVLADGATLARRVMEQGG